MAVNTPLEIVQSYVNLLIMQYLNKPGASGLITATVSPVTMPQTTVQEITFSAVPTSGTFILEYNAIETNSINWNASASTIQSDLQSITGLSAVTVAGSIASLSLIITFVGVAAPALSLSVASNTLFASASSVSITIAETDETLPLAVQDAFNIIDGTSTAIGVQLNTLGKYVGVTRTGYGFTSYITLDDADFLQLINMAIIKNQAGSSLATIVQFLFKFFPGEVLVYDNLDMTMTYLIAQSVGSEGLIQLFVTEGLLPAPMGVGINLFTPISVILFSFGTVLNNFPNKTAPFNTVTPPYLGYWLSAHDLIL